MGLTQEQQAIVDTDFSTLNTLLVNAYAGTGKTSTLIKFCEERQDKKILYLAYNSSMVKEATQKFKHLKNVTIMTMHSLAYRAIGKNFKDRLENMRASDLVPLFEDVREEKRQSYAYLTLILLRNFCSTGVDIDRFVKNIAKNRKSWKDKYNDLPMDYFVKRLPDIWETLNDENGTLPYEHDFYLKAYQLTRPRLHYNFILVDEAQDINGCVIKIVINQNGKKVFIGDTYQSIYKFRGASNSLEKLATTPNSKTLYLTKSFRCPPSIAGLANTYLSILKAPKEFVGVGKESNMLDAEDLFIRRAVISRTNAKLFHYAIKHGEGKKLFFVGGIKSYNFQDLIDLQNLRWGKQEWMRSEFLKKFHDLDDLEAYIEESGEKEMESKIQTMKSLSERSILQLFKELKEQVVTKAKDADLILTTGHKSKGLEWDTVEILNDFVNIPKEIKKEGTAVIPKEELNLFYVAITRSMKDLYLDDEYILDRDFLEQNKHRIVII